MSDVISIDPAKIVYKLDDVSDLQEPIWPGDWDIERRLPVATSEKHESIRQRYVEGRAWKDTDLFKGAYKTRIESGTTVRGCYTMKELLCQYHDRVDGMFAHLREHGFLERVDGTPVKIPNVFLARDGEIILSNDGNHRIAMAKILKLPHVLVRIHTRHPQAINIHPTVVIEPVLHEGATAIPAMSSPAEQWAAYCIAKEQSANGEIVELGAWLGAMTVYLAAGVRDAGTGGRVQSFDRFIWKPVHAIKAGGDIPRLPMLQFLHNIGPLDKHVEAHVGDFKDATWDARPISFLVFDGPKRVKDVAHALTVFGGSLVRGAKIAVQDFAHFSTYDLPVAFSILEHAGAVQWESAAYPGTMSVFNVLRPILPEDIKKLSIDNWSPPSIEATWATYALQLPHGQRPRFLCSAVFFLHDLGHTEVAMDTFRLILQHYRSDIESKWQMIRKTRPEFAKKYPAMDAEIGPWT